MNDTAEQQERPFGGFSDTSGYDGGLQDGSYYNATLTAIKEVHIEKGQWPGWKVEWTFTVDDSGEPVRQLTSQATGPDSTAGPWLITLVGKERYEQRKDRTITPTELVGRECLILVGFSDGGWPRVAGVLPRPEPTPVAQPVAQPAPAAQPTAPANRADDFSDLPF